MEISKTEKVDLSTIRVGKSGKRSDLTTRVMALDPGEAITVVGIERVDIRARFSALIKEGRRFTTQKVGTLTYRIIRVA